MQNLINWYNNDSATHPLVKCSLFTYEFLSIHPFQDGNGRLSRLISTLLLLKNGYNWIQYVSFEHEKVALCRNCYNNKTKMNFFKKEITLFVQLYDKTFISLQIPLIQKKKKFYSNLLKNYRKTIKI